MREPVVLLLNDVNHEGLISALVTAGRSYQQKKLHSTVDNWHSILGIFGHSQVVSVLGKFTGTRYHYLTDQRYAGVRDKLFEEIKKVPHRIFVYEELLTGKGDPFGEYSAEYRDALEIDIEDEQAARGSAELLEKGNEILRASGLEIFPYKKRAEVTISSQAFIEETEQGLLFRLYVPSGRLWETEIGKLLSLFKDYLARIAGISVRLDQVSTNKGVIYAFHRQGRPGETTPALSEHFAEFSRIMDLCVNNQSAAEELLSRGDLKAREITQVVAKYGKEMRRLQVDLKHSREEKILSIRHRLESELVDTIEDTTLVQKLVDSLVPTSVTTGETPYLLPPPVAQPAARNLTINFNPQFVQSIEGIVAQEITGSINLGPEDRQLIELFQKYGGAKMGELTSALHELKDESAPEAGRVTAKQRIKRFLIGCTTKGVDIATSVLQTYIEKKMLGL